MDSFFERLKIYFTYEWTTLLLILVLLIYAIIRFRKHPKTSICVILFFIHYAIFVLYDVINDAFKLNEINRLILKKS